MPPKERKEDVYQVRLGALASLDAVRISDNGQDIYLVVFAERGLVHRRTLVKLDQIQAAGLAKFLAGGPSPEVQIKTFMDEEALAQVTEELEGGESDGVPEPVPDPVSSHDEVTGVIRVKKDKD